MGNETKTGDLRIKDVAAYVARGESSGAPEFEQLALALVDAVKGIRAYRAGPTLAQFWPRFVALHARANRHKPRGIAGKESHYEQHLRERFGARPLGSLKDEDIQQLKADLGGRKPKTVNNILTTLNRCLKFAIELGELDVMPVRIKFLKVSQAEPDFYEFEEYATLTMFAAQMDLRQLVTVRLGGDAGLRLSEKIGLEWADVDFRRELIHVQRSESQGEVTLPKGGKTRIVPLTPELRDALSALSSDATRPKGERVLYRDDGSKASEQSLRTWISKVQESAGLALRGEGGQDHILRHTFCSHLAMKGEATITIKELAGHQSIRTTERYMHLAPSEKGRAIKNLSEARNNGRPAAPAVKDASPTGFEPVGRVTASEAAPVGRRRLRRAVAATRRALDVDTLALLRSELDLASGTSPPAKREPTCKPKSSK